MNLAALSLKSVDKFYGPVGVGLHAVKDLSFDIAPGEIVALLGSSGCGKTSTLRMIAGFETVSRGTVSINGEEVHGRAPVKRNVAMAFEGYSLYPPLTVHDNIAFALKAARLPAAEVEKRVREIAALLEIEDILGRYPSSISGGQQQRASLGRALVRKAALHLLDEPMGQLEPQLRAILRGRIKHYIKQRGLTAILVTHDQTEANALADRIAVMEGGVLQQYDTPEVLKERPANLFTGTFIGEPPMNVFDAGVAMDGGDLVFTLSGGARLPFPGSGSAAALRDALARRGNVVIGVRPHKVHRAEIGLPASVVASQWLGDQTHIAARCADATLVLVEHDRSRFEPGADIFVSVRPEDLHIFDRDTGAALSHGLELVR